MCVGNSYWNLTKKGRNVDALQSVLNPGVNIISVLPGFAPAGEALLFRQKVPKPFPPKSAISNRADASKGGAAQLARLRQGPPFILSVRPLADLQAENII